MKRLKFRNKSVILVSDQVIMDQWMLFQKEYKDIGYYGNMNPKSFELKVKHSFFYEKKLNTIITGEIMANNEIRINIGYSRFWFFQRLMLDLMASVFIILIAVNVEAPFTIKFIMLLVIPGLIFKLLFNIKRDVENTYTNFICHFGRKKIKVSKAKN